MKYLIKFCCLTIVICTCTSAAIAQTTTPLSKPRVKTIINQGTNFLENVIEKNGHFRYEINPFDNTESPDDNIVRQAGSFYILGELLLEFGNDRTAQALKKAWSYFKKQIIFDTRNNQEIAYLFDGSRSPTGANALVLIGLINLAEYDQKFAEDNSRYIEGLKNLLIFMQKRNGGIRKDYNPEGRPGSISFDEESDYYNGEALLALSLLAKFQGTDHNFNNLWISYEYFEKMYTENPTVPFYLWSMLSLKEMYEIYPEKRTQFEEFAKFYTNWILNKKQVFRLNANNGYLMEGVGATAWILLKSDSQDNRKLGQKYLRIFLKRLRQLQSWQITDQSRIEIKLNNEEYFRKKPTNQSIGCFLNRKTVLLCRIDYTQHALSAYRILWQIFN